MHNLKHKVECNEKEFKIPVYVEKETVTVRVHDLPPQIPHVTVVEFMKQYGSVTSIQRERWKHFFPGVFNGVRAVVMRLDRPIPSFVTIDGEPTLVTYRNQPKTCRHCSRAAHPKQKCSKTPKTTNNIQAPSQPNLDDFPPLDTTTKASASSPAFIRSEEGNCVELSPDLETEQQQNDNTENNNTIDDSSSSSSATDGSISAFTEVNQKRRLSRKQEKETKKTCLSQGSQNVSQISTNNCYVALNRLTPTDLN